MSMWIQDQYASVWKCTLQEKVALVNISTSRKSQDGEYFNSSWGDYVRFVGKARGKADDLASAVEANGTNDAGRTRKPVRIKILKGTFSKEPWVDSTGETKYPKNATLTVFDFDFSDAPSQAAPAEVEDDEIPF